MAQAAIAISISRPRGRLIVLYSSTATIASEGPKSVSLQPRLDEFAWVRSPALQPGRQITRIELSNTIDARKEDRGQHDIESERPRGPAGNLDPTLGFDAERCRRRATLKQKEEH